MHAVIARILLVERKPRGKKGDLFITTILDSDGNFATGIGNDFKEGEPIYTYFHDIYGRVKFFRRTPGTPT